MRKALNLYLESAALMAFAPYIALAQTSEEYRERNEIDDEENDV